MSTSNNEASSTSARPVAGTVNEAVRASILAVKASHRAARRRQLRDRLVACAILGLTTTAIWGAFKQFGGEDTAVTESAKATHEVPAASPTLAAPSTQAQAVSATADSVGEKVKAATSVAAPGPAASVAPPLAAVEAAPLPAPAAPIAVEAAPAPVAPAAVVAGKPIDPALAAACEKAVKRNHWITISSVCALAFEQSPNAERALSVAQAFHRRGRIPEAGTWAEKVLSFEPANPEAFIIVAHAAEQAEEKAKAKAAYRQYLALAPRGWHAPEARGALGEAE